MKTATVNGVALEYEVKGAGEPVLLIDSMLADGVLPFVSERALTDHHRLIRYHRRGWAGSTHTPPVDVADHVIDAAALLEHLDVPRAHVVGHSIGAVIALQMALDRPRMVHSLALLEPSFFTLPAAGAFLQQGGPALEAFAAGDHEKALAIFLAAVSGLEWKTCRAVIEARIPGAVAATLKDASTVFEGELPALIRWPFSAEAAGRISQPALSVLGAESLPLWAEIGAWLRATLPRVEECRIEGAGHLLQVQQPEPVLRAIARFMERHPMRQGDEVRVGASPFALGIVGVPDRRS
jgi:pimeloyl-ACP methyl ester carboxylesterase